MQRCHCLRIDGKRCVRDATNKINQNQLFCWQHQNCQKIYLETKTQKKTTPQKTTPQKINIPYKNTSKTENLPDNKQKTQPKKLSPIPRSDTGVQKYIKFLTNQLKTGSNKTFSEILKYNTSELEDDHAFIQWLFPLPVASAYATNIPIIDIKDLLINIKKNPQILKFVQMSYHLIVSHWGFSIEYSNNKKNGYIPNPFDKSSKQYIKLEMVNTNKLKLLNGHNGLRFSRVLQSLTYHGLKDLAIYTLNQVLPYTNGKQALLHPSYHQSGITIWEFLLGQAIKNVELLQPTIQKKPHNYLQHIIGDIGNVGNIGIDLLQPFAVVNAANAQLATGSGVTGALVKSVGGSAKWYQLINQAKDINDQNIMPPIQVGQAVYTPVNGQLLKDGASYIIHALGPITGKDDINLIRKTIHNVLSLTDHLKIKDLILPAISGGIFAMGNPTWATRIRKLIVDEIINYMNNYPTQINKIYLVSPDEMNKSLWPPISS